MGKFSSFQKKFNLILSEMEQLKPFVDEYGFEYMWPQEVIDDYQKLASAREERQTLDWTNYVASIDGIENLDKDSATFKNLIRKGIPICSRPLIWNALLNIEQKISKGNNFYQEALKLKEVIPENYVQAIEKDIPRTFKNCSLLNPRALSNVLYAFAAAHPDIYYCQSLNFIAAIFIIVLGEEPAYWALSTIVEDFLPSDYYTTGMHGFRVDLKLFEIILSERVPEVFKHAQHLHHEWIFTASGWLLTLFSNSFPVTTVLRIWDSFLLEGPKIIYRVAIGFIRMHQDQFLAATKLSEFTSILQKTENRMIDQDLLMKDSFSIVAFSRSHLVDKRQAALKFVDTGVEDKTKNLHEIFGHLHM